MDPQPFEHIVVKHCEIGMPVPSPGSTIVPLPFVVVLSNVIAGQLRSIVDCFADGFRVGVLPRCFPEDVELSTDGYLREVDVVDPGADVSIKDGDREAGGGVRGAGEIADVAGCLEEFCGAVALGLGW